MIQLIDNAESLKAFSDICAIKLRSLAISYGFDCKFCTFWSQTDDSGKTTAIICKFGSALTVSHGSADLRELFDFLQFIGFSELICSEELAEYFSEYKVESINSVEKLTVPQGECQKELTFADYREIYNILNSEGGEAITLGNFEDWYVDIAHRVRHDGAVAVLTEQGCGISLLADDTCIINGIAVKSEHKGKGQGRKLLTRLQNVVRVTRSLAFCLDSELPFYKKCGYSFVKKYSLIK